ncbi:MAG: FAD-linked oxidase C-terminal domain-containing protein [Burkholderiaceae bacterium]
MILGHVGDGNFHCVLLDPNDEAEVAECEKLNDEIVALALSMDGTCTGEHGIGLHRWASWSRRPARTRSTMRSIKRALDPDNLMNPGRSSRSTEDDAPARRARRAPLPTQDGSY